MEEEKKAKEAEPEAGSPEEMKGVSGRDATTADQYIEAIAKLKNESVPREKYEELKRENQKILDDVVNGGGMAAAAPAAPKESVEDLRRDLFSGKGDLSNLEYAKKALALRNQLIESGRPDPFLPVGSNTTPTRDDIDAAQKVADTIEDCIEYAEGDSAIFTNELQRRLKEPPSARIPRRR